MPTPNPVACKNGRLHRQLRPVGERRDHARILTRRGGKLLLRIGVAIRIDETLDIPRHHRLVADRGDEPEEVHCDPRLIAVRIGYNYARFVRVNLEHRADRCVELGID